MKTDFSAPVLSDKCRRTQDGLRGQVLHGNSQPTQIKKAGAGALFQIVLQAVTLDPFNNDGVISKLNTENFIKFLNKVSFDWQWSIKKV